MGDHLVGVTNQCNYPPEAATKPKLGGLRTISLEAVISKNPDIIFATKDGNDLTLIEEMTKLGLKVRTYQPKNLEEVLQAISGVGNDLKAESRAEALINQLKAKQESVTKAVVGAKPVTAILVYQREPLILAGQGTFADDLIKKARATNLAGDSRIPYPRYSLEMVIKKSPEVILDVSMTNMGGAQKDAVAYWSQWPDLPAVKNHRIAALNSDLVTRPGPRIFTGLEQIATVLHPEIFEVKK
jgi:iron complex transport system substrate-binding protein